LRSPVPRSLAYADMHAGHCTMGRPGSQTSGYLALAHLCTSRLPSRAPGLGHQLGGTTAWAYRVNVAQCQQRLPNDGAQRRAVRGASAAAPCWAASTPGDFATSARFPHGRLEPTQQIARSTFQRRLWRRNRRPSSIWLCRVERFGLTSRVPFCRSRCLSDHYALP